MSKLVLDHMKNGFLILFVATGLVAGCQSKPNERGTKATAKALNAPAKALNAPARVYYPRLDKNKCLRVLFPDYKLDSVYTVHSYQNPLAGPDEEHVTVVEEATGKLDTSWYWIPKSPVEIAARYQNRLAPSNVFQPGHLDERIENRNGRYWIKYSLGSYVANDSIIALLYYAENIITDSNRGWTGAAVFKKAPQGWFLAGNDYNFYNRFSPDMKVVGLADVKAVNGKPSLLFIGESYSNKAALKRALLLTDYQLAVNAMPDGQRFEVEGGTYQRVSDNGGYVSGGRLTIHGQGISAIVASMLGVDSCKLKLTLNTEGEVVKLRFIEATGGLRQQETELLIGKVEEASVPVRFAPQDAATYEPRFRVVDLWKNSFRKTATFYTGTQLHAYAEGSLKDSSAIRGQGTRKLEERREVAREVAREADAFNRNLDQHLRERQAQQQQDQAVSEIIRKAGLCQYCSGRGGNCLQCGGTGRVQKL